MTQLHETATKRRKSRVGRGDRYLQYSTHPRLRNRLVETLALDFLGSLAIFCKPSADFDPFSCKIKEFLARFGSVLAMNLWNSLASPQSVVSIARMCAVNVADTEREHELV